MLWIGGNPAGPFVGLAVAGPDDVEGLLEALAVLRPALDDLDAVEVAGGRILHRPDNERRGRPLPGRHGLQVGAHRDAACVGLLHPVAGVQDVLVVAPAPEEANLDVRAADAERLLAVHRVEDRGPRVLLRPHAGQPAGVLEAHVHRAADEHAGETPLERAVRIGVKAEEVVLAVRAAGVVRVGAAGHAELVRVVAADVLHGDAVLVRLARVAARDVVDAADVGRKAEECLEHLVARELVVRRKQRVSLRLPLALLDLDQALVAIARSRPGRIDRPPGGVVDVDRVHPAVADVGVVRDGEELVAGLALRVHPVPQFRGAIGVERAERIIRHLVARPEEDIAVQVAVVGHRRPLVRAERGELAGLVLLVGNLDVFLPHGRGDLRVHERLDRRACIELEQIRENPVLLFLAVRILHDHRLRLGQLAHVGPGGVGLPGDADVLRVVSHAHEVHRRVDLDVETHRVLDGLALGVLQRVRRAGDAVPHHPRVDRPAGVDVLLAEVGVAVGIGLRCGCRCG